MSYVEGLFASRRAKRRALSMLALLSAGSLLHGIFRDVEFRAPGRDSSGQPAPAPQPTPAAPPVATPPELVPEAPAEKEEVEALKPKTEAPGDEPEAAPAPARENVTSPPAPAVPVTPAPAPIDAPPADPAAPDEPPT